MQKQIHSSPFLLSLSFFSSTVLVSFIKSPNFAALTHLSLCGTWTAQPLPPAPISPLAAKRAAWCSAPRRHFPPLCIEKFCEQKAHLQLLQFAENPWPLGLPFSWVHALHSLQLNFRKHFVSSKALESFPCVQRDTGYTPMGYFFSPFLPLPHSNLLFLSCAGRAAHGICREDISFAPSKSEGR